MLNSGTGVRGLMKDVGYGLLIGLATLAVTEPFFPNPYLRDPGFIYLIGTFLAAYFYGWSGGVVCGAFLCAFISVGAFIPSSAFEHTTRNDLRTWFSLLVFTTTAFAIGLPTARARRDKRSAEEARDKLRESEELRLLVLESSLDAIAVTNAGGEVIFWNSNASHLFGWSQQQAMGKALRELTGLDPDVDVSLREDHATGANQKRLTVEMYTVAHGDVRITFMRDISQRKQAESEIRHLNASLEQRIDQRTAELQAKNEELEGFSYAISHDMRSPLRAIVANAQFVLEDEGERVSEAGRTMLQRLAAAALRMSLLVDDLLQYARLGNQGIHREPVDLSDLAHSVAEQVRGEFPDAQFEIEPGLTAEADSMLVSLVLGNLFDNACKYSKPGQAAQVSFGRQEIDGANYFFVRDEGIGFDMEYAKNLGRPFERLHSQAEYPGTGIGLANVKRIVERHGGRFFMESEPGVGSTAFFSLEPPISSATGQSDSAGFVRQRR
ncbi:MAG TPA: ATP-binding protein [Fimbriimonas sp.]|nr:ATP-binding protein [Fimbriimonas sp.]